MHISTLALRDFRNYRRLELELPPDTTLIYGSNAAGKTSLLEALFYLATTRSPRASTDRELLRWGAEGEAGTRPFARIAAAVQQAHQTTQLEVIVQVRGEHEAAAQQLRPQGSAQKLIRVNRKAVRAIDLVGHLRVVLFTPTDLTLVDGSPSQRRRYLDITLSQLDPRYVRTLAQYGKLVQQRNSLLRAWRDQRRPPRGVDDELGYWDAELARTGGYLLAERLRAVAELNTLVGPLYHEIAGGSPPLQIGYDASCALGDATTPADLADVLHARLRDLRRDELARGQTLLGPHRDDLLFTMGGVNLGIYGSRGQQRSAALALKLGEARMMHQRSNDMPLLLLDDMLSELDTQRRRHVLRVLSQPGQQTLLTATGLSDFDAAFLRTVRSMRVEDGHLYPA